MLLLVQSSYLSLSVISEASFTKTFLYFTISNFLAVFHPFIDETNFSTGICPIYQNVTATAITKPEEIKVNLKKQLTAAVLWTQTMQQMIADGLSSVTEVGPGKVLQGLFKKVDRKLETQSASL